MSVSTLIQGLIGLFLLLVLGGSLAGIGPVELMLWLGLVAAWVLWWAMSRRNNASP